MKVVNDNPSWNYSSASCRICNWPDHRPACQHPTQAICSPGLFHESYISQAQPASLLQLNIDSTVWRLKHKSQKVPQNSSSFMHFCSSCFITTLSQLFQFSKDESREWRNEKGIIQVHHCRSYATEKNMRRLDSPNVNIIIETNESSYSLTVMSS